ncbi:TAXI family TRAP transporter solute-binding subunit [Thermodesulfobacteriota bacterium]
MEERLWCQKLPDIQTKAILKGILAGNLLIVMLFFFSIIFSFSSPSYGFELGLKTGSTKGTYYQIARDLSLLSKGYKLRLNVMPSEGSVENIIGILADEKVHLAIVQDDVMAFIKLESEQQSADKVYRAVIDKTRWVFPLYNEEIHVLGKKSISSFEQLQGKRVAVGSPGSGTRLTSNLMFSLSGIKPAKEIETGAQDSLSALMRNQVDAMIQVAGYPVKLFEEFSNPRGFHLIPVTNRKVLELYTPSLIPRKTYNWQNASIDTAAVKAALVTIDYDGKVCDLIGKLGETITDNIDWLRKYGHPKWKSVDLDFKMRLWNRSPCIKSSQ